MIKLKLLYSSIIPPNGFYATTLFDCLIRRNKYKNTPVKQGVYNHEMIHATQARDFGIGFCGYIIFYILYILEWILKLPFGLFGYKPYMSISFEQEAYNFQSTIEYLKVRKRFSWVKYIFKLRK